MSKKVDAVITALLCLWVALQFISCQTSVEKTSADLLVEKIQGQWLLLKKNNLVHGSIRIEQNGKTLFEDGPQAKLYTIASLSKSFVGAAFTDLEKQGLSLNQPACQWLANFCKGDLAKITLQQLLDHRSGFGKDLSFVYFLDRSLDSNWSLKKIDTLAIDDGFLNSSPGAEFRYSNFGYLVLSRLWELITKKPFSQLVIDQAVKAQLINTSLIQKGDLFPIQFLIPFADVSKSIKFKTHLYDSAGTGGIKSSVSDLSKWLDSAAYSSSQNYARGWVQSKNQSYKAIWHNGAALGSYSLAAILPDQKIKIVIVTDNFKFTKQWSDRAEQFEQYFY